MSGVGKITKQRLKQAAKSDAFVVAKAAYVLQAQVYALIDENHELRIRLRAAERIIDTFAVCLVDEPHPVTGEVVTVFRPYGRERGL